MRRLPGLIARLGAVVALVVSAVYVVVYLYRWEWNRALIAGVFFLAAEIAVAAFAVLDRLGATRDAAQTGTTPLPAASATAEPRFRWLDPTEGGFAVFVPVLLGLGVLLTFAASVVERIARWTAPAQPPAVLVGLDAPEQPVSTATRRRGALLGSIAAVAALSVLAAVAVRELADVAQSREEPPIAGAETRIALLVEERDSGWEPLPAAERLVARCLPDPVFSAQVSPAGDDASVVLVRVTPALGRTDQRKLTGCLEDAVLDRLLAHVEAVEITPTG